MNGSVRFKELMQMINLNSHISPSYTNKQLVRLIVTCEFEPWGRASENWDAVYRLEFPYIRRMHKGSSGLWRVWGKGYLFFQGESADEVIRKAGKCLEEIKGQGLDIPWVYDIEEAE